MLLVNRSPTCIDKSRCKFSSSPKDISLTPFLVTPSVTCHALFRLCNRLIRCGLSPIVLTASSPPSSCSLRAPLKYLFCNCSLMYITCSVPCAPLPVSICIPTSLRRCSMLVLIACHSGSDASIRSFKKALEAFLPGTRSLQPLFSVFITRSCIRSVLIRYSSINLSSCSF